MGGAETVKIVAIAVESSRMTTGADTSKSEILVMTRSPNLIGNERRDDTARLHIMQELINTGMTPHAAAAKAATDLPDDVTGFESLHVRLRRKFNKRAKP